jgi:hypothetical protein
MTATAQQFDPEQFDPEQFDPEDILAVFTDWTEMIRLALRSDATTDQILAALNNPDEQDRHRVAQAAIDAGRGRGRIMTKIAEDCDHEIRSLAASGAHTRLQLFRSLLRDPHPEVRAHLARNPRAPQDVLQALSKDSSVEVVAAVATAPHLHPTTVASLARHRSSEVRCALTQRVDLGPDLTERLAKDRSKKVRTALVTAAATQPEILTVITSLSDPQVRKKLIECDSTGSVVLVGFMADPLRELRDLARLHHLRYSGAPRLMHPANSGPVLSGDPSAQTEASRTQPLSATAIYWLIDADYISTSVFTAALRNDLPLHLRLDILSRPDIPQQILELCATDPLPEIHRITPLNTVI